ncbi:transcriptional regulator with XRE-family HTH domain [Nocardia transvalensis]|uniref:Transcriptional regulator with XRE-family HTH domain n=1 Tax=Nocardia transvalensis TaxID=37333 RepID=A0A7W9PM63_9NOCA|nr:helix-turn-helix transcriptional regulator [Nocardia transvalensis]MBB5918725.1 transcriptional regulator with XRE-family HTH domain [Nocardia transvalensis]
MAADPGSTVPRRQLGRYLREGRQACNLTLAEAARLMEWSEAMLQRLETGKLEKIRTHDVRQLCQLYNLDEEFAAALAVLAQQAGAKSWYHDYDDLIPVGFNLYVGLESSVRAMTTVQPFLVPGLLQTEEYARTLACAADPDEDEQQVERRVQLKVRRQSLITRKLHPVTLDAVIYEAAVRNIVGGRRVMGAQLRHLADMSTLPNITVRVLPLSAGMPLGELVGPCVILEFGKDKRGNPIEPSVVYVESYLGDIYLEKKQAVERYHRACGAIADAALDDVTSRGLLRRVAREYDRER